MTRDERIVVRIRGVFVIYKIHSHVPSIPGAVLDLALYKLVSMYSNRLACVPTQWLSVVRVTIVTERLKT